MGPALAASAAVLIAAACGPCPNPVRAEPWLAAAIGLLGWRSARGGGARRVLWALALACAAHALQDSFHLRSLAALAELRAAMAAEERCELEASVSDSWLLSEDAVRIELEVESLSCASPPRAVRAGALLTLRARSRASAWSGDRIDCARALPGDHLRAHARLAPIRHSGNPGAFDSAALLMGRGILLTGSVKSAALCEAETRPAPGPVAWLARARLRLQRRLEQAAARLSRPHPATAPLLAALLLGRRTGLDPDFSRSLQASGLFHLVAISGLHIVLLGWFLLATAAAAGVRSRPAALGATALLAAYVALVGAPASALRAFAMLLFWEAGRWTGRRARGMAAVAPAGALLVLALPGLASDAGFWMSLCATLGLAGAWAGSAAPAPVAARGRALSALRRALAISTAAYLAVAPLEALWFQRWTPIGILLNLAAAPLSGLLLISALMMTMAGAGAAAAPFALAADLGVRALEALSPPFLADAESFRLAPPDWRLLAVHLAAAAGAGCRLAPSGAWMALLAAAHLALICPALPAPPGELQMTLWDAGQGESVLVRLADGTAIAVDAAGRDRAGTTVMERQVLPALRASGIRRLRALALTHLDADHASGTAELLGAMRPERLWVPAGLPDPDHGRLSEAALRAGARLETLARGERRRIGGAEIAVLWPERVPGVRTGGNAGSLVLRIADAHGSLLLAGDLEAPGERALAARGVEPTDVLKVAHHGSRGSSDPLFLRALRPRVALISAGSRNAWGHPHPEALARLRRLGARIASTSDGGAVRARLREGRVRLERWEAGSWRAIALVERGGRGESQPGGPSLRADQESASQAPARTTRSRSAGSPTAESGAPAPGAATRAPADADLP